MAPGVWKTPRGGPILRGVGEPDPSDDEEFDEKRQEALEAALSERMKAEDRRGMARQLVEDLPEDAAGARSALLGLVERAIGRLTELAAADEARWEAGAMERAERMTFDPGPDDERLWRHQFTCGRSMQRMLDTLLKLRRANKSEGRSTGSGESRSLAPTAAPGEAIAPAAAPSPCPPDKAVAPEVVQPPLQNEAGAPAVDRAPVPDEAAAPAAAPSPLQDEDATPVVDRAPVPEEAAAPLADPSSLQNELSCPFGTLHPMKMAPDCEHACICWGLFSEEASAPVVDHPGPQNEASAPAVAPTPPHIGRGSRETSVPEGLPPISRDDGPFSAVVARLAPIRT